VEQNIALRHWINGFNVKLGADGLATSLMEAARNYEDFQRSSRGVGTLI
jgi:hypothetical protein